MLYQNRGNPLNVSSNKATKQDFLNVKIDIEHPTFTANESSCEELTQTPQHKTLSFHTDIIQAQSHKIKVT